MVAGGAAEAAAAMLLILSSFVSAIATVIAIALTVDLPNQVLLLCGLTSLAMAMVVDDQFVDRRPVLTGDGRTVSSQHTPTRHFVRIRNSMFCTYRVHRITYRRSVILNSYSGINIDFDWLRAISVIHVFGGRR